MGACFHFGHSRQIAAVATPPAIVTPIIKLNRWIPPVGLVPVTYSRLAVPWLERAPLGFEGQ